MLRKPFTKSLREWIWEVSDVYTHNINPRHMLCVCYCLHDYILGACGVGAYTDNLSNQFHFVSYI